MCFCFFINYWILFLFQTTFLILFLKVLLAFFFFFFFYFFFSFFFFFFISNMVYIWSVKLSNFDNIFGTKSIEEKEKWQKGWKFINKLKMFRKKEKWETSVLKFFLIFDDFSFDCSLWKHTVPLFWFALPCSV